MTFEIKEVTRRKVKAAGVYDGPIVGRVPAEWEVLLGGEPIGIYHDHLFTPHCGSYKHEWRRAFTDWYDCRTYIRECYGMEAEREAREARRGETP